MGALKELLTNDFGFYGVNTNWITEPPFNTLTNRIQIRFDGVEYGVSTVQWSKFRRGIWVTTNEGLSFKVTASNLARSVIDRASIFPCCWRSKQGNGRMLLRQIQTQGTTARPPNASATHL